MNDNEIAQLDVDEFLEPLFPVKGPYHPVRTSQAASMLAVLTGRLMQATGKPTGMSHAAIAHDVLHGIRSSLDGYVTVLAHVAALYQQLAEADAVYDQTRRESGPTLARSLADLASQIGADLSTIRSGPVRELVSGSDRLWDNGTRP